MTPITRPAAGPIVTYLGLENAACADHARRYGRREELAQCDRST